MEIANKIMQLLVNNSRRFITTHCAGKNNDECYASHLKKIKQYVIKQEKILFVLPAFPAKSPNAEKTSGFMPDLGERLSLRFLNEICDRIKSFYAPGAQILICSDGRVFNDLVKVPDKNVDAYAAGIRNIIREDGLQYLATFDLDNHYGAVNYESMREKLIKEYGEPLFFLKDKIKKFEEVNALFNGIHRFIYEDQHHFFGTFTNNQIRKTTKKIAYQVIQRSNAWSRLIEKIFPDAVRLSIHPQACGSEKLGIMLLRSKDVWATPWHRVVLFDGREHILVRKKEAEILGAWPVFQNKEFSHYKLPCHASESWHPEELEERPGCQLSLA